MKFTVPAHFSVSICKNHKAWEGFRNGAEAPCLKVSARSSEIDCG
jgi:hypothetical protein